ncbi:MAG: beta-ribofuranosylaminobenzene 5'-phosphate synthase family protein, partial [Candidatus Hecatellaceae archaeon]
GSQGVKPSLKIKVSGGIPRHVGLGSGTQLALGVAKALAEALNLKLPVRTLARLMGRGGTSGIGVAAFEAGGIIVDGGHSFGPGRQKQDFLPSHYAEAPPPPVLARFYPPEDWRWVVVVPPMRGAHGLREAEFFREQCPIPASEVAKASRIVLMKLMPALAEADVEAAGEALNMLQEVGFKRLEVQLAGSLPKKLMQHLVDQGAYGAGLSSFGPAIYALTTGEKAAENLSKAAQELLDRAGVSGLIYKSKTNVGGARILKI